MVLLNAVDSAAASAASTPAPAPVDLRFRTALGRLQRAGRIRSVTGRRDTDLEIASILKKLDGDSALVFPDVAGYAVPVIGNLLASPANCEAAFGLGFRGIRELIIRCFDGDGLPPRVVPDGPVRQNMITESIDLAGQLPALLHAPGDGGRFITAGVVIARHPETGIWNASYHRLQLLGGNRTAIRLDLGRHLRNAFEAARRAGTALPIAVAIGTDLSLLYTAATMGSQMPEERDELAAAGALAGAPLEVLAGITQPVLVPAHAEFALEAVILPDEEAPEGPFGEFVGYFSDTGPAPVVEVTALTHRDDPVYFAINGAGRETVMLRKYVLEASVLKVLRDAVPIVSDVDMTEGGLHRFHLNIAVSKQGPQHEGLQRNAALAAFGALKDLVRVVVTDDDIDIHSPRDVEYAIATRCDAAHDLVVIPGARGHEYVRVSDRGVLTKWLVDATVPPGERQRFSRVPFAEQPVSSEDLASCDLFANW
jgi:2,5-furandicarboxylate decarboxylase 1